MNHPSCNTHIMQPLPYRLFICGKGEVNGFASFGVTHLLSLEDPGTPKGTPMWFRGIHEQLHFHDVESTSEAATTQSIPPCLAKVRAILDFGQRCLDSSAASPPVTVLVHCHAGVSRSPAAAFALARQALGEGKEREALGYVLTVRPYGVPNSLVVRHADALLGARGALLRALAPLKDSIRRELEEAAAGPSVHGI